MFVRGSNNAFYGISQFATRIVETLLLGLTVKLPYLVVMGDVGRFVRLFVFLTQMSIINA